MNLFEALMLFGAGLFAGGALTFAWSRVAIWRRMPLPQFVDDFAQTLSRTDKVQPALLVTGAASAAAFAATSNGTAAALALAGAAGLLLALIGSLAVLVPLQRRADHARRSARRDDRGDARPLVPRQPRPLGPRDGLLRADRCRKRRVKQ